MSEECGCYTTIEPTEDGSHCAIVYCPTHARAFEYKRVAEAARKIQWVDFEHSVCCPACGCGSGYKKFCECEFGQALAAIEEGSDGES